MVFRSPNSTIKTRNAALTIAYVTVRHVVGMSRTLLCSSLHVDINCISKIRQLTGKLNGIISIFHSEAMKGP